MRLIHTCNESSGPSTWPGCMSPGYRKAGPVKFLWSAQAAVANVGDAYAGCIIIDPWGRWPCDGKEGPQTLLDQWERATLCKAVPLVIISKIDHARTLIELGKLGSVALKLGFPPDAMTEHDWLYYLDPAILARVGYYEDGAASREPHVSALWAKFWGIWHGVEALPAPGSPQDSEDIPAFCTVAAFRGYPPDAKWRNPVTLQYRGWQATRDEQGHITGWEQGPDGPIEDAIGIAQDRGWNLAMNCNPSSEDEKGWEDLEKAVGASEGGAA